MAMSCNDENGVEQTFRLCFHSNQTILYVLIILSLTLQIIYAFFIVGGKQVRTLDISLGR